MLFGLLLGLYEFAKTNRRFVGLFKRQFGFLVYPVARAGFLIFVSLLQFGLDFPGAQDGDVDDNYLGIFTGCLLIFFAAVIILLRFKWPEVVQVPRQKALSAAGSFQPPNVV